MSSTHTINFSLRQNKAIERAIAFDALKLAQPCLGTDFVYVGLGSVWFQDFQLAHRSLGIRTMISIEGNQDVYARAEFNKPFASIEVVQGWTDEVLPDLLGRADLVDRPWIVWLDYDAALDDGRLVELAELVTNLPDGSALLTTFNAAERRYATDTDLRHEALCDMFGQDIVGDRETAELKGRGLMGTLADCLLDHLLATAVNSGRDGGFVPAVRLLYRDSASMVTVGGLLPDPGAREECDALVAQQNWCGFEDSVIETQPLTLREVHALSQLLPSDDGISQQDLSSLGFALSDAQLEFFQRHYLRYPTYAEVL